MPKTKTRQTANSEQKTRLYIEIEEKVLLRVVLPLQKAGMTAREIAAELKVGIRRVDRLIQQAEEKEALKLRNETIDVRACIQQAMDDLRAQGAWPEKLTARRQAIAQHAGISSGILSKHTDLWHLGYLEQAGSVVGSPEAAGSVNLREAWNQHQAQSARERIQQAVADLLAKGALPAQPTARFRQLVKYKISGTTLYKHRDLWDPECVQASMSLQVAQ